MVGDQYPDTMSYENADGFIINLQCRFRPVKFGPFVKRQDGTDIQVKFDIAFPVETPSLLLGTIFNATNERGDVFVYKQELLSFHVGSFHCLGRC